MNRVDAREHLAQLVGKEIPTLTGKRNRILRLRGNEVLVATTRSPLGRPVPVEWIQSAIDRLLTEGELEINVETVGYRSAFVGAVLLTLPGVEGSTGPRRVRLVDPPPPEAPASIDSRPAVARERGGPRASDVGAAIDALYDSPRKVPLARYETLGDVSRPGLYSWWVDVTGAGDISRGLRLPLQPGLVYVGQAGATQWPSGKRREATLASRISSMHLGTKISFSTLRLTLAACLRRTLRLRVAGAKILAAESESALTEWMTAHLEIAVFGYDDVDALDRLERLVLKSLDPPLNLQHVGPTPLRARLRELRAAVAVNAQVDG